MQPFICFISSTCKHRAILRRQARGRMVESCGEVINAGADACLRYRCRQMFTTLTFWLRFFFSVMNMIHRICTQQQTLVCIPAQTRVRAFGGAPSNISGVFVCVEAKRRSRRAPWRFVDSLKCMCFGGMRAHVWCVLPCWHDCLHNWWIW